MRRLLVDEIVSSWHNGGSMETTYSGEEVLAAVYRSISGTVRFNGTTRIRHTVLVHSWFVGVLASHLAPDGLKDLAMLMGMMHDFGETIVGDFVMPVKSGAYKEVYDEYYLPLEAAFRAFVGEEVLGIRGFAGKFAAVEEFVGRADSLFGDLEFYADVHGMGAGVDAQMAALFNAMESVVTVERFDAVLRDLAGKLGDAG